MNKLINNLLIILTGIFFCSFRIRSFWVLWFRKKPVL